MKRNLLLLSGIVVLSFSANAQQLKEEYMTWPNSSGLPGYVNDWTPGTPLFEDENFYISRVKPKKRIRNAKTQVNDQLAEKDDKKLIFWVPICTAPEGGLNVNARPNGVFDSEAFSTWSYVDHYGNWTAPHGWVPGGFADIAHKNGVAVSGVASIPNTSLNASNPWRIALTEQAALDNEKLAKFLHYHGVDGLGYNSEFSGLPSTTLAAIRTQHEDIHKYLVGKGNQVAENVWYDGTNDSGYISFDNGIGNHNKETFGDGEHIRTSLFFNYNWHRGSVLSTLSNLENVAPGRNPLDIYAGFNMQGGDPSTWTTLAQYPMSIGLWGAHNNNMLWSGRAKKGSADVAKQLTYQGILEQFFTNGNRNPAKPIAIYNARNHFPNDRWFGMSAFMSARSSLSWDLAEEPFITFFNLGNGRFFNWKGERQNDNEWYNIGVQDYLPTWRYWFAKSFLGRTPADVEAIGLNAEFTYDDAYVGGSCLRIYGSAADEYLHLFKTEFELSTRDVITVRYKLIKGQADVNLALSIKGTEETIVREDNLKVVTTTEEADDEIWVEKKFTITGALNAAFNGKEIAMIALHFKNAENLELYLGEFSITRGEAAAPAAPEIAVEKLLANHHKGVDAKLIFNMPNTKEVGEPVYNIDVNASMFKLYAQQEGGEPIFMGITTSWAGMYYSIPVTVGGTQRVRLGVAAVSIDTKSDSPIKWGEYMDRTEYATIDDIQINKTTIKPGESFEISFVDPLHGAADWKLYNSDGVVVKDATDQVKFSVPEGLEELGGYALEVIESGETRRFDYYVQITGWNTGALPEINSLTLNGAEVQDGAPGVTIETGDELTLGYTGRAADGAASRAVEIDEGWVGCKVDDLEMEAYQSFSVSSWVRFTSVPGSSAFFSIEDRSGTWPVNHWGWSWSNILPDGKLATYTFRSNTANGSTELKYQFPNTIITPNAWNHVAMVFEYNERSQFRSKLYLNGVLQESTWEFGSVKGETEDWCSIRFAIPAGYWMVFGGGRGSEPVFNNGIVDELQVWNGVMSQDDVTTSMNGLKADNLPANVIAYWDFDTDADDENFFAAKGTRPGARACVYKTVAGENEGSGVQHPQFPLYISGTPFIEGSVYRIETKPVWSGKRALITEADGNDTAGSAKLTYAKTGDRTVTLTLENVLGSDSRDYPVFTINEPVNIEDMDAAGELRTYTVENTLFVEFAEEGNYDVAVYTVSGMLAAQKAEAVSAGQNMRITLGASGIYLVKVMKDGKEVRTIKVLKN